MKKILTNTFHPIEDPLIRQKNEVTMPDTPSKTSWSDAIVGAEHFSPTARPVPKPKQSPVTEKSPKKKD